MLTQEDADILPKLWRRTKKAHTEPELLTAISRFEDSYLRTKPEDKLIDYWIALESLFFSLIKKEYVGSMGDTVASTIAFYLGSTHSERRSIYEFMISSHIARGYFVHGHRGVPVKNLDLVIKKTKSFYGWHYENGSKRVNQNFPRKNKISSGKGTKKNEVKSLLYKNFHLAYTFTRFSLVPQDKRHWFSR